MKNCIISFLIEAGLTVVGIAFSIARFFINPIRQLKALKPRHLHLALAGIFIFLIGCGLLSLLGKEPFALPILVVGLVGLLFVLAKQLVTFGRIGLILIQATLLTKR
mgnify:CR=1 FL=1